MPDEYKTELIDQIVYHRHGEVTPGDDTEPIWNDRYLFDIESSEKYDFYVNVIIPQKVVKPNSLFISSEDVEMNYPSVYEKYSNKNGRIVMSPNVDHDAGYLLMIGKELDGVKVL